MFIPLHDRNPLRIIPFQVVTLIIIGLCVLVFLLQQLAPPGGGDAMLLSFGMVPAVLFDERVLAPELDLLPAELTLVSSMFLHGGWMHLIGNMLFLWVFGDNIEDSMGHVRYLVFYLVCGLFGGLTHAFAEAASISPLIGASGAVSGVLGAYLMLHPRVKVLILVLYRVPLRLPAFLIIAAWLGLQIFNVIGESTSNTAWWAHIGGFAAGVMLIPFFKRASVPLFDRGIPH